jgi:MFS family permease
MYFMTVLLFIIAFLDFDRSKSGAVWAQASLMDIWTFIYQMTAGPICFVIISEISATRLRGKTIAITTAIQALASIVFTVAMPYTLNSDQANWRGKAGFLFGGVSFVCCIWSWLRIPESRGLTFEELDILFERRIPLRQFGKVNLLEQAEDTGLVA